MLGYEVQMSVQRQGTKMSSALPYLTKSKLGWYEYRRGIPAVLRPAFGNKREFKRALKTKTLNEALIGWSAVDKEFNHIVSRAKRLQDPTGPYLTDDVISAATTKAKTLARPMLAAGAFPAERNAFDVAEDAWLIAVENTESELADRYVDSEKRQQDYNNGKYFEAGYQTPYLEPQPDDPDLLALNQVKKGIPITLKPTWADAVHSYFRIHQT